MLVSHIKPPPRRRRLQSAGPESEKEVAKETPHLASADLHNDDDDDDVVYLPIRPTWRFPLLLTSEQLGRFVMPATNIGALRSFVATGMADVDLSLPAVKTPSGYIDTEEKKMTRCGVANEVHDITLRYSHFLQKLVDVLLLLPQR